MTFGLVDVSYTLSEGQAVKLTFFAPCKVCMKYVQGTHRLLRLGRGGGGVRGGYNFLRGLILGVSFENAQNVRGVEILRHRGGLLCKSCQTIL